MGVGWRVHGPDLRLEDPGRRAGAADEPASAVIPDYAHQILHHLVVPESQDMEPVRPQPRVTANDPFDGSATQTRPSPGR
jgi:hypothetical protein